MSASSWENVGEKIVTLCNYTHLDSNMTNSLVGPNGHVKEMQSKYWFIPSYDQRMINSKKDYIIVYPFCTD